MGPKRQAICDASGFKCNADELVRQWNGMMVLPRFLSKRNPQDFVTGVPDNRPPAFTRPEPADVFLAPGDVTADDL